MTNNHKISYTIDSGTDEKVVAFFTNKGDDGAALLEMHTAITHEDLWLWLKTLEVDPSKGFWLTRHPNLTKIENRTKCGHSGSSFAFFMRHMEMIAKEGWDAYCKAWKSPAH